MVQGSTPRRRADNLPRGAGTTPSLWAAALFAGPRDRGLEAGEAIQLGAAIALFEL